ncbi:MAG TPA: patatin-like phospholipase family protein [Blastocatellia bacterium]|nr:patatin-like phospholipase family protein [Blastocatellia bacterium]
MAKTATTESESLPLYQALEEEYVTLHGALPDEYYQTPTEDRLKAIYDKIHALEKKRAAMCISGGGIRSATFALGVLQGLARRGLLDKFDFLSTVSGGGYVGSWLSAWIHRNKRGPGGVFEELYGKNISPGRPEASPIRHLRAYSNYLSPKLGLLSADTWTLAAIIFRNLLLNWTVLIPLLAAVLMVPMLCVSVLRLDFAEPHRGRLLTTLLLGAFFAGVIAVTYMGVQRPSLRNYLSDKQRWHASQIGFLLWCLLPTFCLALFLSTYWGWLRNSGVPIKDQVSPIFKLQIDYPWPFFLFGLALHVFAWAVFSLWVKRFKFGEFLVSVLVGFIGGVLLWFAATQIFPFEERLTTPVTEYFVCFALPLILGLLLLAVTLFVGLGSRITEDEDREWLARYAAWVMIVSLGWAVISFIVIFGPVGLLYFGTEVRVAIAAAGGAAGLITVLLGHSAQTAASKKQEAEGNHSPIRNIILALAAPLFIVIFLVTLSLGVSALIFALKPALTENLLGVDWHASPIPDTFDHLNVIHNTSTRIGFALFALMGLVGFLMALSININKFSLHSMYRNRLIRAYLGASQEKRRENPFTGFDPNDNVQMHELRPELFHASSFVQPSSFVDKLRDPANPVSEYLKKLFSRETQRSLDGRGSRDLTLDVLIKEMNTAIDGGSIYEPERFEAVRLDEETRTLLKQNPTGNSMTTLNRLLLEQAYPGEIKSFRSYKPMHVINMALNLVGGDNLAWQQRKAESFTSSPLHSGSYCINSSERAGCGSYRSSKEYGGDDGISLGTAVAISGAAVSPNMGYHSSAAITFLLTLFNARLGWWLGNPGKTGDKTYHRSYPLFSIKPLLAEAFGLTDDKNNYVYLSDGGHFENLAIYEMVLRRCHYIVVSDGSQDPDYQFDDLGSALRKIRVDLGVPIVIEKILIYPRNQDKESKFCAIGTIRYCDVDGGGEEKNGVLIYIKPAIGGKEPADVYNYAQTSKPFPHEPTADQYFSESQFESYRMLGFHAVEQISEHWPGGDLKSWAHHIRTVYLKPPSTGPAASPSAGPTVQTPSLPPTALLGGPDPNRAGGPPFVNKAGG